MPGKKFENKYRIPSARLTRWDYSREGAYFITICTKKRQPFFGDVVDGKMQLSPVGAIADVIWCELESHNNIELGAFQVMPDHMHGIIFLRRRDVARNVSGDFEDHISENHVSENHISENHVSGDHNSGYHNSGDHISGNIISGDSVPDSLGDVARNVSTEKNELMSRISPKAGSLSTIIRSYKSSVTKHANRLGFEFDWHPRFHDHIIRDAEDFERITQYIKDNPANWKPPKS